MNFEKIYKEVAEKNGVSVEEVKREMNEAVKCSDIKVDNLDDFIIHIAKSVVSQTANTFH